MFIVVTKQIGIEAETIEAGIAAVNNGEGKTIGVTANERPQGQNVQQGISGANIQTKTMTKLPTTTTVQPTNG